MVLGSVMVAQGPSHFCCSQALWWRWWDNLNVYPGYHRKIWASLKGRPTQVNRLLILLCFTSQCQLYGNFVFFSVNYRSEIKPTFDLLWLFCILNMDSWPLWCDFAVLTSEKCGRCFSSVFHVGCGCVIEYWPSGSRLKDPGLKGFCKFVLLLYFCVIRTRKKRNRMILV